MKQLIQALNIFAKYIGDSERPTDCNYGVLYVQCDPSLVSDEDKETLEQLGFSQDTMCFCSFKYGS